MEDHEHMEDVLGFLKREPFRCFVLGLSRNDKYPKWLANRVLTVYGFAKGRFSVIELFLLMLPARLKSGKIRAKYTERMAMEVTSSAKDHIKDFILDDGSVDIYGHPFYPADGNYGELLEFLYQIFAVDQYCARRYLNDDSVVIDAGANIGSFSVFCSNMKKNLTIHAFEPTRRTFETLKKNASPYKNIFCHNLGLGDEAAVKRIYFSAHSTSGSAFEDGGVAGSDGRTDLSEEVKITTIDDFVRQNDIPRVDFIKIDTEGYERKILAGAKETIKRCRPIIAMSAYHKADDKTVLPEIVRSISPDYDYELVRADEEDLIFFPRR